MFGSDIEEILKKVPQVYQHLVGIRAVDEIPQELPVGHFVIVNTE